MTDEDRDLLELAAKAAGIDDFQTVCEDPQYGPYWNPLADDGDALRLAAKLGMDVRINDRNAFACNALGHAKEKVDDGDVCRATRRAIVSTAAEIGKAMKPAGVLPPLFDKDPTNIQY